MDGVPPLATSPFVDASGFSAAGTKRSVSVGQRGGHTAVIFIVYDKIVTCVSANCYK